MIIEIIGPSGSGKTTISAKIIQRLMQASIDVFALHPHFFPFGKKLLRKPCFQRLQNPVLDFIAFKTLCGSYGKHREFFYFAKAILKSQADSPFTAMNLLRSVHRKVGLHEYFQRKKFEDRLVLVDEGMAHGVHNLFVHFKRPHNSSELTHFASLFSLPDLILYIKSPLELLVERSLKRQDLSRRAKGKNVTLFLERADKVFEEFVSLEHVRSRTLILENANPDERSTEAIADKAVAHIMKQWKRKYA